MTPPAIGVTLIIRIDLFTPDRGGRATPIRSGYRPLCVVNQPDGGEVVIGLCELQLSEQLRPGDSGEGRLSFSVEVSQEVRSLLGVGSRFTLAEGRRPIGSAEVRGID
jgi:translation elongation factor EF-Tu-like GTPase